MAKALIIVDPQNDFCEGGPLEVKGSNGIFPAINALKTHPQFSHVFISQDWHPANHVSFASTHKDKLPFTAISVGGKQQELWPDHCVAGSSGAAFSPLLNLSENDIVVRKGIYAHVDSYSAFFFDQREVFLRRRLEELNIEEVFVCGLAFDFCVGSTALDARKYGLKVSVVKEATRSTSKETEKEMQQRLFESQVKLVTLQEALSA